MWTDFDQGYLTEFRSSEAIMPHTETQEEAPEIEEAVKTVLSKYQDAFDRPEELPLKRMIEHHIHLKAETDPVNVRPYRYGFQQKDEMKKLVNEMLSSGGVEVDPEKIRAIKQWLVPTNNTMMTLSLLALPDFSIPFEVETDPSGYGIGAVLMQNKRPIAFYSHTLAMRDRAKPVYERELMASSTTMETLSFRIIQPQYQKWIAKLLGYSFEVVYKPGLENKAVNALSRMQPIVHLYNLTAPTLTDLKAIKEKVDNNERLKEIIRKLQSGEEVKNYSMQHGILRYKGRVVIAKESLIPTIMHMYHDSVFGGHSGFLKTNKRMT
ncbi:transposon Tf2-1 polyprotein isoform X1 [Cucumis melo var. makuwa]|uniref:Transposon Tf2-1 polyprotein isoform X1 n=1 Tax=Cucumis melo var. makuwa TaxID=1194695 RepID=A0A5A7UZB6_CUCMM|nr:transposon Tf2-1 polyprotein isoform X1 [Cucumis melo var. makuwa]TYK09882.1 transposon Tf2-1 polyprotein isoform X1 [Cucumis melo var. makuwa]